MRVNAAHSQPEERNVGERVAERVYTLENAVLKYLGCDNYNYSLKICKCDLKIFSHVMSLCPFLS